MTITAAEFFKTYKPLGKQCNSQREKVKFIERLNYTYKGVPKEGFTVIVEGEEVFHAKHGTCLNEIVRDARLNCNKGEKFDVLINTVEGINQFRIIL